MGLLLLLIVLLELLAQVYLVTTRIPTMMDYDLENSRMDKTSGDGAEKVVQPLIFAQLATWSNPKIFKNYESFAKGSYFVQRAMYPIVANVLFVVPHVAQ